MLGIFRTNQSIANLLLILYALLLRFSALLFPDPTPLLKGGYWGEILNVGLLDQPQLSSALSTLLVLAQAILINILVARYRMAKELSLFPGVFYLLLCSLAPPFLLCSPILVANTFLILAWIELFSIYKSQRSSGQIFNAGLWIAVGSLFYPPVGLFLLFAFITLGIQRAFRGKEAAMVIMGFIVPFWLMGTYAFVVDEFGLFIEQQFLQSIFPKALASSDDWRTLAVIGLLSALILLTLFNYRNYTFKKKIQVQKLINILYLHLLFGGLSLLLVALIRIENFLLVTPVLGVFLSFNFIRMPRATANALHLLLLFTALLIQFFPKISLLLG